MIQLDAFIDVPQATANRDAQVARGNIGTIVGLSERSDARLLAVPNAPGQMVGDAQR